MSLIPFGRFESYQLTFLFPSGRPWRIVHFHDALLNGACWIPRFVLGRSSSPNSLLQLCTLFLISSLAVQWLITLLFHRSQVQMKLSKLIKKMPLHKGGGEIIGERNGKGEKVTIGSVSSN